jgi:hypothetical protein
MNPFNAFKHCYWSCEMAKQCGYATALLGYGYEFFHWDSNRHIYIPILENWASSQMDFDNNSQGRQCAEENGCAVGQSHTTCCIHKLAARVLAY